jgi:hypothetical protein
MNTLNSPSSSTRVLAALLGITLLLSGCLSPQYKMAKGPKVPPDPLNVAFPPGPLEASLSTLITYKGHGSWKREALWDEYVVTFHNPGAEPLVVTSAVLADHTGFGRAAGTDPWALEKESKQLEKKYRHSGMKFARNAAPAVVILGGGAGSVASVGVLSAGAATAAVVTIVALPVYYLIAWNENTYNKADVQAEFDQRRVRLPLTLAPGESRAGSLFFPMTVSPRSLTLHWQRDREGGDAVLALDFLKGLHLEPPARK